MARLVGLMAGLVVFVLAFLLARPVSSWVGASLYSGGMNEAYASLVAGVISILFVVLVLVVAGRLYRRAFRRQ